MILLIEVVRPLLKTSPGFTYSREALKTALKQFEMKIRGCQNKGITEMSTVKQKNLQLKLE